MPVMEAAVALRRPPLWRRTALACAAGLGLVLGLRGPNLAFSSKRNPCEEDAVAPRRGGAAPVGPAAAAVASSAADDPQEGYLLMKPADPSLLRRPVFVDDKKAALIPDNPDRCVWLPLRAGRHKIHIGGQEPDADNDVEIKPGRTYLLKVREDSKSNGNQLARLAFRVERANAGPVMVDPLREVVARAALAVMDLRDEQSLSEPSAASDISAFFKKIRTGCDPKDWSSAPLQYLLVLTSEAAPGQPPRFAVRVYNTAVGMSAPAASSGVGSALDSECTQADAAEHLHCTIQKTLEQAAGRLYSCLQIRAQHAGVKISLRPLSSEGPAANFATIGTTGREGLLEYALFAGLDDQQEFELAWELPDYAMAVERNGRQVQLEPGNVKTFDASLRRTRIPVYRQWWLWQILGTAAAIGVGGAVGASFAGRGAGQ